MGINHEHWMREALKQAYLAQELGEVPVGAVVVYKDEIIAQGFNQPINKHDPSAHAEMNALRKAAIQLKNYRLTDTTLYVTLEPCMMCAGLLLHARVSELVFGAYDPKIGIISTTNMLDNPNFNHQLVCTGGILEESCSQLLTDFFKAKR